jgi:hypothetical protein
MVPKKGSHATIKNRNGVYGNKCHVKLWFKKWKNRPKIITRHALRRDGFCLFIQNERFTWGFVCFLSRPKTQFFTHVILR